MANLLQWQPEVYQWLVFSLILLAERFIPVPHHSHPWQLLRLLAQGMARKVYSLSHSRSQQRISGLMATLTLLVPWLVIVAVLLWISDLDWVLSALCLYIAISSRQQRIASSRITDAIQQRHKQLARELLQSQVTRDTAPLSEIGLRKANLEWYSRFIIQGWLATLLWFIILGPVAALAYRGLYELAMAWPIMRKSWHDFGFAASWLSRRLAAPANLIGYLILAARHLLGGNILPWRITQQPFMHAADGRIWRAMASQLKVSLGGPIILEGEKRQRPRFTFGHEPTHQDLIRGRRLLNRLQLATWLIASPLFLIGIVIH